MQGKVLKKRIDRLNGNFIPCSSTKPSLRCAQTVNTQTFMCQQTRRTLKIFHKLTSKSQSVNYLISPITAFLVHIIPIYCS